MTRLLLATALASLMAAPLHAQDYVPVTEKETFLSLIQGKSLRIPFYGLTLNLTPDGQIVGRALGWGISGKWVWEDGFFCRDMDWSGMEIPYNCQLVEARGDTDLRFTVDQGAGDSASFKLR